MSFFYVKQLAFVLIGIVSSYKNEEKLEHKKVLQTTSTIFIIVFFIANAYGNITLKVAEDLANDKKKIYDFELANRLAPYSLEVKKSELEYLEPSQKDIKRQTEIYKQIAKTEKGYDRILIYNKITKSALFELKKGRIAEAEETLKHAIEILKQRENKYLVQISNYNESVYSIYNNIDKIKDWKENSVVQKYIKESSKHATNIEEELENNIKDYKVTRFSKEFYEETKREIKCYEEEIQKIVKEL
jgi:hypothetical protein